MSHPSLPTLALFQYLTLPTISVQEQLWFHSIRPGTHGNKIIIVLDWDVLQLPYFPIRLNIFSSHTRFRTLNPVFTLHTTSPWKHISRPCFIIAIWHYSGWTICVLPSFSPFVRFVPQVFLLLHITSVLQTTGAVYENATDIPSKKWRRLGSQ